MSAPTTAAEARAGGHGYTPPGGVAHGLRAVNVMVKREMIRTLHEWGRPFSLFLQSLLWLFVVSSGFGALLPDLPDDVGLDTAMFPGVITMTVVIAAVYSASSVIADRDSGFLREMLVAPVSRASLALGKVVATALLATGQGAVVIALGGFVGVPYHPGLMLRLVLLTFVCALAVSAFAVMVAALSQNTQSYFGVSQLLVMPMVMLSGALFPVGVLPPWLARLALYNPVSYTVDPMRQAVFGHVSASESVHELFNPGMYWFGHRLDIATEVLLVAGAAGLFLALAVLRFRRID
ncbi:ABC transporter permease [Nocardiopsis quinghaiensis]|uniref:ABC transporter permease n=1 Tax=Nocardiopsis quinghaiensis TaxID=464995 RepID=UPI00123C2025|nr:ABC transporter permease [Nocardiopsis quinghaiensis]